jgi:hypothetical protein
MSEDRLRTATSLIADVVIVVGSRKKCFQRDYTDRTSLCHLCCYCCNHNTNNNNNNNLHKWRREQQQQQLFIQHNFFSLGTVSPTLSALCRWRHYLLVHLSSLLLLVLFRFVVVVVVVIIFSHSLANDIRDPSK